MNRRSSLQNSSTGFTEQQLGKHTTLAFADFSHSEFQSRAAHVTVLAGVCGAFTLCRILIFDVVICLFVTFPIQKIACKWAAKVLFG